jgi:homogentisate 1,2-dioxygenase
MTLHPQGIDHGPQPNARTGARNKTETHEVAVMVETWNPLRPCAEAAAIEVPDYVTSWSRQARAMR